VKAGLLKTLEAAGVAQAARTDPDARLLNKRGQKTAGYNVQIAVDARHKLIVADEVVQDGNDLRQLHPMLVRAKAAVGTERLEGEADKGYYNLAQIAQCEADGITVYAPEPDHQTQQRRNGPHPHEAFDYLPGRTPTAARRAGSCARAASRASGRAVPPSATPTRRRTAAPAHSATGASPPRPPAGRSGGTSTRRKGWRCANAWPSTPARCATAAPQSSTRSGP
jgi:hypothetical protein